MSDKNQLGMFQSVPGEYEAYLKKRANIVKGEGLGGEFAPFSESYVQNPYLFFERARQEEPVFYSTEMDYWVVMNYEDIISVFKDPVTFSAANARHPVVPVCPAAAKVRDEQDISIEPCLVDEDQATHKAHRRIFGDAFTPKRVNQLEPQIRAIVNRYIDRFIDDGQADLVSQMLYEVPALAIFLFIGAKDEDAVLVKDLGSVRAIVNFGYPTEDEQVEIMGNMSEHWEFTKKLVDDALEDPGDNYLGDMIRLYREDSSRFTINYLYNVMFLMQFAGHETTTQASANGLKTLLTQREQWDSLCADPSLIPNAVEEILRIDPSIYAWRRIATKDTEIGGKSIPAGSKILLMLGSGNHDETMFPNPTQFDASRKNAKRHFALGNGAHFCMGAPLARLEMRIILEELTRRLPHMTLVKDQPWEYVPTLAFRGVQKLQVAWDVNQNP